MSRYFTVDHVNAHLTLHASDGDSSRWPEISHQNSSDGTINYFEPADDNAIRSWRDKIGTEVVRHSQLDRDSNRHFVLTSFPAGYKLFVHRKGTKSNPRKDYYLHGSTHTRQFRSPAEFFFHAKWIMQGCPPSTPCRCTYCSRRKQRDVDLEWSRESRQVSGTGNRRRASSRPAAQPTVAIQKRDYTGQGHKFGGALWTSR